MGSTFFIDYEKGINISYNDFIKKIKTANYFYSSFSQNKVLEIIKNLTLSIINSTNFTLYEIDSKQKQLGKYFFKENDNNKHPCIVHEINSPRQLINDLVKTTDNWKLFLYTSGTTGNPKEVGLTWKQLTRNIKKNNKHSKDKWALAYNPAHYAGIQVILQAMLNRNLLVNIFDSPPEKIEKILLKNEITHISATPTFYRKLLMNIKEKNNYIKSLGLGGEKSDNQIIKNLIKFFPNARIINIYASTEAGTLFGSNGTEFHIPEKLRQYVRISKDLELLIHRTLMADVEGLNKTNEWYNTGDLIEFKGENKFVIIGRKNNLINVGGYKVNPHEIETLVRTFNIVQDIRVYSRPNKITGNIPVAELVIDSNQNKRLLKKRLIKLLRDNLQDWKIPKMFYFVKELDQTKTGKLLRK